MDVFELSAKLSLDSSEYEESLEDAETKGTSFGSKVKSALGTATQAVGQAAVAAAQYAASAISGIVSQSVEAYSNYEQLAGGVNKLFGDASSTVMAYADEAFSSAGMSANDYMETVTSFSASLISGLGGDTEAAAEIANDAIVQMSDNANTFGTDIESIQNAYQGFAKGNYTMLDNLKLGYGGTEEEMIRLINDSGTLNGTITSMDDISFDQIITAIGAVQENIGIAGTTANEAASTIEGSGKAMAAAWQNMLVGIADDNADFGTLVSDLADTVVDYANNMLPRIQTALEGIGSLIQTVLPTLLDAILPIIMGMLPDLISTISTLALDIVGAISDNLPTILNAVMVAFVEILTGLAEMAPELTDSILECVDLVLDVLTGNIDVILDAVLQIILAVGMALIEHLPEILESLLQLVIAIADWIISDAFPMLWNALNELLTPAGVWLANILNNIIAWLSSVWTSISTWFTTLVTNVVTWFTNIYNTVVTWFTDIWTSITTWFTTIITSVTEFGSSVLTAISDAWADVTSIGTNLINGIWEGISTAWTNLTTWVSNLADGLIGTVKNIFGIASPSKVFRDQIGKNLALGIGVGFETNMDDVKKQMSDALDFGDMTRDIAIGASSTAAGGIYGTVDVSDGGLSGMYSLLSQYLPQVANGMNQNIVLDTGALVGQTAAAYNSALGTVGRQRVRATA